MEYRVSLQMPQRTVLLRRPAGVAASHCDIPGHGILDWLTFSISSAIKNRFWFPVVPVSSFHIKRCVCQLHVLPRGTPATSSDNSTARKLHTLQNMWGCVDFDIKPGYEDILGIAQGFEAGSRFFLDVGCFMFWDEVGQSSGSRCERRFDDVVLQHLAYFQGPLFGSSHKVRPRAQRFELRIDRGRYGKDLIYCYYTWRYFTGRICFKSGWKFTQYHVMDSSFWMLVFGFLGRKASRWARNLSNNNKETSSNE